MEMKERKEGGRKEGRDSQKGREVSAQGRAGDKTSFGHYNAPGPITTTSNQDILGPVESRD